MYESPFVTISKCIITGNTNLYGDAGGIACYDSTVKIEDCIITGNTASISGGAIRFVTTSGIVNNSIITGNTAYGGGGFAFDDSSPTVANCVIAGNTANSRGGGILCYNSNPLITNCLVAGNAATNFGGGIYTEVLATPSIVNCTIVSNRVFDGYGGGIYCTYDTSVVIDNSIVRSNNAINGPEIALTLGGFPYTPLTLTVSYSNIAGGQGGIFEDTGCVNAGCVIDWMDGNIDVDPCFADLGYWDTNSTPGDATDDVWVDGNFHLMTGSLCIDAGDNTAVPVDTNDLDNDGNTVEPIPFDLNGFARFIDDLCTADTGNGTPPVVDMGAYEFLRSDIDSSGGVNFVDFAYFAPYWLDIACGVCGGADLTCDGDVNWEDLNEFTDNWLEGSW